MDNLRDKFMEEANDLIADLEKALLELENQPDDQALVQRIFRAMHTLKGSSSMFGFENMGGITHHLETIYDFIRDGKASITPEIINTTLATIDQLKLLLVNNDLPANKNAYNELSTKIVNLSKVITGEKIIEVEASAQKHGLPAQFKTYYILFRPDENILKTGGNPLFLLEDLHALGSCKVTAHVNTIPLPADLKTDHCYIYWDIYLATQVDETAIRNVFMFVEGSSVIQIHKVSDENLLDHQRFLEKIDQVHSAGEEMQVEELKEFIQSLLKIIKNKNTKDELVTSSKDRVIPSIRVSTDKLDNLMNMVSELVTAQARLSLIAEQSTTPELVNVAENIEKISRQLRDNAFSICLIPIENLITRFQRLVRDLSAEMKKDIVFLSEGGDTELDKNIIENLTDPLLHILRNSIDHGIESAEKRIKSGKQAQGKILFKAFYSGNYVHIQVKDDGGGLDPQKIKAKAIEKGLIDKDAELTKKEIFDLIFLPGFSTAEKVTGVSGRGVGMDVVKRKISELRGEIELESKPGEGTSITIKLPLTLSIIDGLLVKVGKTKFVVPLLTIEKCYEVLSSDIASAFNNQLVVDGEKVTFFYLRREFSIEEAAPEIHQMITVQYQEQRVGLVVDHIIGEYQAVLKPLGKYYKNIDVLSGGTILGDGSVALVIDPAKTIRQLANKITI